MACWEVSSLSIAGSLANNKQLPGKVSVWEQKICGDKKNITSKRFLPLAVWRVCGNFASSLDNQSRLSSQALTTIEFCLLVKKIFLCLILKRTAFWKETFGVFLLFGALKFGDFGNFEMILLWFESHDSQALKARKPVI